MQTRDTIPKHSLSTPKRACYHTVQGGSNFCECGLNPGTYLTSPMKAIKQHFSEFTCNTFESNNNNNNNNNNNGNNNN